MVADAELIRRVQKLVDELDTRRGIAARPAVSLTDEPTSSARHGGRRRRPDIRISRAHVVGDPDALRGVVAHEYAHAVDERARRDIVTMMGGLLTATLVPFAVYTYSFATGQHTWASAVVSPGLAAAACWIALTSHRCSASAFAPPTGRGAAVRTHDVHTRLNRSRRLPGRRPVGRPRRVER